MPGPARQPTHFPEPQSAPTVVTCSPKNAVLIRFTYEIIKIGMRRRVKGGGLNTPQKEKNKFKAQKTTLKDLWGPETWQAGGHK